MKKKHRTIPIFIPHLACPFQCVFCNQKYISGIEKPITTNEIHTKIEQNLSTINVQETKVEVGFFGGSFTCLPLDTQKSFLEPVQKYIEQGIIHSIRLSTRPDFITDENLLMLKSMHVETIELGVQSLDADVLKKSDRGYDVASVIEASRKIKKNGFRLGHQLMIGLPGDSREKTFETAIKILELAPDDVRIYPTLLLAGTQLAKDYLSNNFVPLTLEEAVQWTVPMMELFLKNKINVIKVGLHPSESYADPEKFLAGPFHPSFREMVMTQIWQNIFNELFEKNLEKNIIIEVNKSSINYAIGYKSANSNLLKTKFNNLAFRINDNLEDLSYEIHYS